MTDWFSPNLFILGVSLAVSIRMRRVSYLAILMVLLFGMTLIPPVDCQNADGLTWGVTEDQEFRYQIVKTSIYTPPALSDLYLYESHIWSISISYLPSLPTTISNWTEVPHVSLVTTYIDFWKAIWDSDIVPVGNWPLLQDLDTSSWLRRYNNDDLIFKNASYFENSTCWGYSYNYNTSGAYEVEANVSLDCTVLQTKLFNKADGMLLFRHTSLQFYDETWDSYDFGHVVETAVRIAVPNSPAQENNYILLLGTGSIVSIILILAVFKIRAGRK